MGKVFRRAAARWRPATLLLCALAALALPAAAAESPSAGDDPVSVFGVAASTGAAPGYLPDRVCGNCHGERYASYQSVGMARSFRRATPDNLIEDFSHARFVQPETGRHYAMQRRGDALWFRRWTLDADGHETNLFETRVDWILGSGNHARSYLYQTSAGELYQLPIGWYSQSNTWAMSPGFEQAGHAGVTRRVRRECMFCHNAFPQVPAGSDGQDQPQVFPSTLPEGTGCQRCHGPGAEHVRSVLRGQPLTAIRAAIVNPARLPWPRRNDVCFQCHLLPAVELIGPRRVDRGDYSFRPGEALSDYLLHVDIDQEGRERSDRFQINHHAYRLLQSTCYRASGGQMGCVSCHDPHRKPTPSERAGWFRDRCRSCHQDFAHREPAVLAEAARRDIAADDCSRCHMPKRRTQDVVEVVMTDHRIARGPFDEAALQAPLQRELPTLTGVGYFDRAAAPHGWQHDAYLALAVLNALPDPGAVQTLEAALAGAGTVSPTWWQTLAAFQLQIGPRGRADAALQHLAASADRSPQRRVLQAAALLQRRQPKAALAALAPIDDADTDAGVSFNAGLAQRALGDEAQAARSFRRALDRRPIMVAAWYELGRSLRALGRHDEAAAAFRRCLQIEPDHARARRALAALQAKP